MIFNPLSLEDKKMLKRALAFLRPYKIKLLCNFLCILISIFFSIVEPLVWGKILANLFRGNYNHVIRNIGIISFLYICKMLFGFLQTYLFTFLNNNIINNLKIEMYESILSLPVKAFDEMRVGDFLSRMQGDASKIASVLTNQLLGVIVDIIKVVVIGVTTFSISRSLSVIVIMAFPISYMLFIKFGRLLRKKNEAITRVNDDYFSSIQQSIIGIREIKSLGSKQKVLKDFINLSDKYKSMQVNFRLLESLSQSLSQCVNFFSQVTVMAVGGYLIYKDTLKIELFIAFQAYSNQFSGALMNVTRINSTLQQCMTSLERIFAIIDDMLYTKEEYGHKAVTNIRGDIIFDNISFGYTEETVLKGVSFRIKANSKTAIVGSSGSGKTTIFNLLLRFYNPNTGRIMIDGVNIDEFDESSLRNLIAIVRQEPFLFNISIKENLLLANPNASYEDIWKACEMACIHGFIVSLQNGYDTIIGENGVNLSGGQKQRIAIARVLLKKSKIILFDEATSALDNESQFLIKEAMSKISQNHTIITIAHRLSTVIEADEIIVMEKGNIVGQEPHFRLIEKNSTYKKLYELDYKNLYRDGEDVI